MFTLSTYYFYQCCGIGGKMSYSNSDLTKISDTQLLSILGFLTPTLYIK